MSKNLRSPWRCSSSLNEVVGLVEVAGQYEGKSPQSRHKLDHPSAELVRHAFASREVLVTTSSAFEYFLGCSAEFRRSLGVRQTSGSYKMQ